MKLLVIEDEIKAGEYLKKGLIESGYTVDLCHDGVDGLYHASSEPYDLIVLDIMLPKLNGWQVLNTLRSSDIATPIIMLTAKDQVDDRVRGFELGANDYLVKPYAFAELLARIQNALRQTAARQSTATNVNAIVIDVAVKRLRSKVDKPYNKLLIHTVRGMGYKFEATP